MPNSLQTEAIFKLAALQNHLHKALYGPLSDHGISFTEFQVLYSLALAPDKKMRRIDLARQVGLTASGVTRVLNPMQKIGLVKKEENARDARVSLVALTPTGARLLKEAELTLQRVAEARMAPLNDKALKQLVRSCEILL